VHGMTHPSLEKKVEPERRSRSPMNPMVPGPRKVQTWDEELFEKWLDENYLLPPGQTFYTGSGDVFYLREEPWDDYHPLDTWWKRGVDELDTGFVLDDLFRHNWERRSGGKRQSLGRSYGGYPDEMRLGIGTISGITPWEGGTVSPERKDLSRRPDGDWKIKQETKGTWEPRREKHDEGTDGEED